MTGILTRFPAFFLSLWTILAGLFGMVAPPANATYTVEPAGKDSSALLAYADLPKVIKTYPEWLALTKAYPLFAQTEKEIDEAYFIEHSLAAVLVTCPDTNYTADFESPTALAGVLTVSYRLAYDPTRVGLCVVCYEAFLIECGKEIRAVHAVRLPNRVELPPAA